MPWLRYQDVQAALDWLTDAFGIADLRWTDGDGVVRHTEMRLDRAFVELSSASEKDPTPQMLGAASGAWVVFVDDVDAHCRQTRSREAEIVSELQDRTLGLRQYTAVDPGGTAGSSPSSCATADGG